ncbi:MAG: acyl-CoA dehydrogenase family protein [Acidimicrobiales bacterium]
MITETEFRDEVTSFLDQHTTRRVASTGFVWGEGSDEISVFEEMEPAAELEELERAKAWRAERFDAGLGWISGPTAYGGRELPGSYERTYGAIESRYVTPNMGFFTISLGMVAPTILAHGSEAAKEAYLAKLYRGDLVGCQLFSEPGAGSDLAGLATRAERDGDEWVISGQKVWTSFAHLADIGEIICRTDPDAPKHRGLTGFVLDMRAPGVDVRPLRQMTGGASFNEVYFDEVRVADDQRLGDVNAGWGVALTTLMNERAAIGGGNGGGQGLFTPERVRAMLDHFGLLDDPIVRDRYAHLFADFTVAKWNGKRALDKIRSGQLPGPELSTAKLALTNNMSAFAEFVAAVLGPRLIADSGEWGTFAYSRFVLGVPGMRVAGGTDEVMRNIVAERVLGLPKDPSIDAKTAFRDLPR